MGSNCISSSLLIFLLCMLTILNRSVAVSQVSLCLKMVIFLKIIDNFEFFRRIQKLLSQFSPCHLRKS